MNSPKSIEQLTTEIQRFEAYIKTDPKNAMLWINLGDRHHQAGHIDEALACFEKCLTFDEGNMVARGRLANILITQHRFDEAERIIQQIIESQGPDNALLHNLGLAQFYQSKFDEAYNTFNQARSTGLRAANNLAYMVYALHKQNKTGEALELAEVWSQESPSHQTEGYISMIELDHGDMATARERASQVVKEQPNNPDANTVLGTWYTENQEIDKAEEHYKRVVEAEPNNPRGWQGLGLVHLYNQNFAESIKALEAANNVMEGYPTNHLIMGWAKMANQDPQGAETSFRAAIDANSNFAEAHGGLASALVFQNKLDEARLEIKKAMGLDPKGFGAVYAQSISLQLRGKEQQATKLLAKVLQQSPADRSKPMINHIEDYLRKDSANYTKTPKP